MSRFTLLFTPISGNVILYVL